MTTPVHVAIPSRSRGLGASLRIGFVVFGGMIALQSSSSLDLVKVGYLLGTVVCLVGALVSLVRRTATPARFQTAWLVASAALLALLALSFFVARANGTGVTEWLRDGASYALFASAPVLALDARSVPRRTLVAMLVTAGLLGAVSWGIEWVGRRGIVELPIARLVLPSAGIPGTLYIFAIATALTADRRRNLWAVVAGVVLALFLVTGTRSALLLLLGPAAIALALGRSAATRVVPSLGAHVLVALALVLAFQVSLSFPGVGASSTGPEPGSSPGATSSATSGAVPSVPDVGTHLKTIPNLAANPGADPSVKERVAQYLATWQLFVSSPLVGVGPGHPIEWVNVSGVGQAGATADTPLVLPAKFGLLGVAVFALFAAVYVAMARRLLRRGRSAVALTLLGLGAWILATLPLGFVVEDKGASLGLMLVLAMALHETSSDTLDA
jgi:hypothetical protein